MDAQELLKIIQDKDQTIAQLREQLLDCQMVLAQQKSATTQPTISVFRRLHVEVLLAFIISYLDVKSISKCAVTANSTYLSFTGVFRQHRIVFEQSLTHFLNASQALSLYPIQCSTMQEWWQACGRFSRFSRRDPAYVQIFNCFALGSKNVSLKYLLEAFARGARPDYSLRMLSQPNYWNGTAPKSRSKKPMYHDGDTIKGSFRVGIDFVTRSLAIPKVGMAKIQVFNAKAAKLSPTDLVDPCSCFLVFFQRGDARSYREATLAVQNICGGASLSHHQTPQTRTDSKFVGIPGALVSVNCRRRRRPNSPFSDDEEESDDNSSNEESKHADHITANAIKFSHSHKIAYYDLEAKNRDPMDSGFMKELDKVFVALGQKCADKVRRRTIETQRRPARGGLSGQRGAECMIQ